MTEITDKDVAEALDRIARTADGQVFYLHLQRLLMGVLSEHDPSDGALRHENGRRRFASELMAKMAKGIEDSAARSADSSPVVFRTQQPVRVAGRQSARDWHRDAELRAITPGDGTGG